MSTLEEFLCIYDRHDHLASNLGISLQGGKIEFVQGFVANENRCSVMQYSKLNHIPTDKGVNIIIS